MHSWTVIATKGGVSATKTITTRNKAMDSEFTHNVWSAYGVRSKENLDDFELQSIVYAGTAAGLVVPPSIIWALLNQISLAFIE